MAIENAKSVSTEDLRRQIVALAPWHIDVEVTPELSTSAFLDGIESGDQPGSPDVPGSVSFVRPRRGWEAMLSRIYPAGLEGRRFLDCACNCGAYSFWAREMGASECFGFDVREHWIEQARFLLANRTTGPTDGLRFEVRDLYELGDLGLEPAEVTMFQGIFYHLPDPIAGLKIAADLTSELLILDTAMRVGAPDGMLAVAEESREKVMSGVHGLAWFPTGPEVLKRIVRWLGFPEMRIYHWRVNRRGGPRDRGRIGIVASRKPGLLDRVRRVREPRDVASARETDAA